MKKSHAKKALFTSVLALVLCIGMLMGTTFAWFTDTVSSAETQLIAGVLDIEMTHTNSQKDDESVTDPNATLFNDVKLWEPGAVTWENFNVINKGNLAVKFIFSANFSGENVVKDNGKGLSDVLKIAFVDGGIDKAANPNREEVLAQALANNGTLLKETTYTNYMEGTDTEKTIGVIIYWEPGANDNDFNLSNGRVTNDGQPLNINLGMKVVATQKDYEEDSFDKYYDEKAPMLDVEVTPATIQDWLNGKNGDLENKNLVLAAGDYGTLVIGTPTKYEGSHTTITCPNGNTHSGQPVTFTNAADYVAHRAQSSWCATPEYYTTVKNLGITAAEAGVNVDGVVITSGHMYGDVYDYVIDKDYDVGSAYYSTLNVQNLSFDGINFTGVIDINTSDDDTVYDGVSFKNCSFANTAKAAIRYYNEANNGNVKNITVENCTFNNCYQGVYVHNVNGLTVNNCTFDTTTHNAIALQSHGGAPVDMKAVTITGNTFNKIGDRIIRFGDVGANTQITIKNNTATDSGDDDDEVIKATTLASGITYDITANNWGAGKIVANTEFNDK